MTLVKKIVASLGLAALVIGGVVWYPTAKEFISKKVGGVGAVRSSYNAIGTASSLSSLTNAYSGASTTLTVGYLENLHLDVKYRTAASGTNQYAMILVEASNDGGVTFFPFATKDVTSDEIDLYSVDLNGAALGIPVVFPGTKTSATGTTYSAGVDFDLVADTIRISAKQSQAVTTSTEAGTIHIRAVFTNP